MLIPAEKLSSNLHWGYLIDLRRSLSILQVVIPAESYNLNQMMILNARIQDIGPFKGSNNISSFSPAKKHVHLIVGVNGSGKTILLNAICWAIGLYDPKGDRNLKRWIHRGCKSGRVNLTVQADGKIYEISRTAFELTDYGDYSFTDTEIYLANEKLQIQTAIFQREIFADLKPKVLRYLMLYNEEDLSDPLDHPYKTPEFVSWVKERIMAIEIPWVDDRTRHGFISCAVEQIGGPRCNFAFGERAIASMLLSSLFREWLVLVAQVPSATKRLRAEPFPWLMDCPFSLLDKAHQKIAGSLISKFKGTVFICINPIFDDSAAQLLHESIGSISAITCGWNLKGKNHVSILGRSLELTRNDDTEFSEIISCKT